MLRERQMTKRPVNAACGATAPRMLLERYWERLLRRIKGSAESIEHTSDWERPHESPMRTGTLVVWPRPECGATRTGRVWRS
jgi:hypothetical protein